MKIHKKILVGLSVTAVFVVAGLVFWPGKALAFVAGAPNGNSIINNATFSFKNRATIVGNFGGETVTFTDSDPLDTGPNDANYKPPPGSFCTTGGGIKGITLKPNPFSGSGRASTITAEIDLDWTPNDTEASCQDTDPKVISKTIQNPSFAYLVFEWDEQNLLNLISGGTLNGTGDKDLFMKDTSAACGGGDVVILNSGSNTQGTEYILVPSNFPEGTPFPDPRFTNPSCKILKSWPVNITGTRGEPATEEAATGAGAEDTPSCEKNFSSVFTYFLCPALDLADSAAGALFGFVENQLCFNTGGSATGGVECEGDVILTDQVKASWSAFRVIATALLVIIMLVMVISQAFSVGPFDPYTVRRLLPRILAAVILIQLSWVMLKFFIDVSNDVGSGIAELMFAPFGGIENMRLDDLAGKAIGEAAGTTTNADVFAFFAVIAAVAVGIANLPGLFALAFFAVVGLFIAFAVLIIRKLLIILLVLLAPLALIAWILPAGESYWKTWKDNFSKLLLMFPMIMAMIAAGRIMAFVASQSAIMFPPRLAVAEIGPLPVPYFADAKAFVSLAIIIIAFFAPYFLILKTFSWAGSLMRVVASGATNNRMMRNLQEKGGERVGGLTERLVTGRYAKKYDPNQGRLRRTGYSIMGGRLIPTKYRQAVLTQRGDKWAEQRNAEAGSYVGRGYEKALAGYDIYDMSDGKFGRFSRHTGAEKVDANGRTVREGDLLDAYGNKASKLTAQFTETTKSDAYKERVTGVEAGKQFLVDSAGLEGDDAQARRAMAAHKLLLDTRSEIELQGSYIQSGKHEGKRTVEVPTWDITLAASPPHYAATTRSRPDFAPDVKQSAESRTSQRLGRQVSYADVPATDTATRRELDKDRLRIALERLSPESLQNAHYGFFDDITRLNDKELSTMFASTLENFWINAGQPGNVAVGSLRGAKESHVNDALAQAGNSLDQITRGRSTPPASSGEVRIDH